MKLINLLESPINIGKLKAEEMDINFEWKYELFHKSIKEKKYKILHNFNLYIPSINKDIPVKLLEIIDHEKNSVIYYISRKDLKSYIGFIKTLSLDENNKNLIEKYKNPIRIHTPYIFGEDDVKDIDIKSFRRCGLGTFIYQFLVFNKNKSLIGGLTQSKGSIELWLKLYRIHKSNVIIDVLDFNTDSVIQYDIDISANLENLWNKDTDAEIIKILKSNTDKKVEKIINCLKNDPISRKAISHKYAFSNLIMYKK